MHRYEECSSQVDDIAQQEPRHVQVQEDDAASSGDASTGPQGSEKPSLTKHKLVQPVLQSYSKSQTVGRLQTVVLGSYALAFRAALLASVGVCYTQYLWALLRTRVLKVSLVEDLFQIQTNALHLASARVYISAPILAAVAVFSWLAPIALAYTSGTLVIELLSVPIDTPINVSVFHAKDSMYTTSPQALSRVSCYDPNRSNERGALEKTWMQPYNASVLDTCESFAAQSSDLNYISRLSLMSGTLTSSVLPIGENASYSTHFWGTTLECQVLNRTIEKTTTPNYTQYSGGSVWVARDFSSGCRLWSSNPWDFSIEDTALIYRITQSSDTFHYYPCTDGFSLPETGIQFLVNVTDTVCRPRLTRYALNVSYYGGAQHILYDLDSEQSIPAYSSRFKNFNGTYEQWVHFSDAMAVYYDFASNFNRSLVVDEPTIFNTTDVSPIPTLHTASNGTIVETCLIYRSPISVIEQQDGFRDRTCNPSIPDIWALSVFERRYTREYDIYGDLRDITCPHFDAELAKELLINTTISMLSLNLNIDTVNGTTTRTFNMYRFRDKLAFFLPYSLSLGLAIPIIVLGLAAFYTTNDRTSAITGGFLQLFMTTTGNTQLHELLTESATMGGRENVTDALREAEITFGELVGSVDDVSETGGGIDARSDAQAADESTSDVVLGNGAQGDAGTDAGAGEGFKVDGEGLIETRESRAGFGLVEEVRRLRRRNV
ncbi:hypothetical protein OPT61_g1458 [Boeremia exigua]|uniref:Uncharacterized protein n=1 Tax=Boeremia exigua TaxID=749465 RepID=A0ACC2IQ51_9PLEO|nr:hypothetical protein OPT61_g1458 [Boeremia exigua]